MDNWVIPPYGKEVLMGNWVDRRYGLNEKGNGILPGLCTADSCEKHKSLSHDSYKGEEYTGGDFSHYFLEQRIFRIRNYFSSTTSNVKLMDNPDLLNNCTTTNTLAYDILPKLRQELQAKRASAPSGVPEQQLQLDFLQCFGNQTKTYNYIELWKRAKRYEDSVHMTTSYDTAFNRSKFRAGSAGPITTR